MKVRLAFAVAAHLEPEVLIIDEVLAVGDLSFQRKCLGKMDGVSKSGRTIIFVSHDMGAVEGLCNRVMVLNGGKKCYEGDASSAIMEYRHQTVERIDTQNLAARTDRTGAGNLKFTKVEFNEQQVVTTGGHLKIKLFYEAKRAVQNLHLTIKICRNYQEVLMAIDSKSQGQNIHLEAGRGSLEVHVPTLYLMPKEYTVDLWANANGLLEDKISNVGKLLVEESDMYGTGNVPHRKKHGLVVPPKCQWTT